MPLTALNIINQNAFQTLAIFICNLFISGKFYAIHITFSADVFNSQLIDEINKNCFEKISWTTADLATEQSIGRNDTFQLLELVFLNLNHSNECKSYLHKNSAHYQLLVFTDADSFAWQTYFESFKFLGTNTLIAIQKPNVGKVLLFSKILHDSVKIIYEFDQRTIPRNLFNETFGKLESSWAVAVSYPRGNVCMSKKIERRALLFLVMRYLANFFATQLSNSFLNSSMLACEGRNTSYLFGQSVPHDIYNELSRETVYFGTDLR